VNAAPVDVVRSFVDAINRADLFALRAGMTEDHTFTDALGQSFSGAEGMIAGWKHFLDAFPGYWIRIDHSLAEGERVALFGEVGGRWRVGDQVLEESWKVAAAWLAEVDEGKVQRWSIFCDTGWATPPTAKTHRETW
jgi:limonene-1,2-epoxide hydrolase